MAASEVGRSEWSVDRDEQTAGQPRSSPHVVALVPNVAGLERSTEVANLLTLTIGTR